MELLRKALIVLLRDGPVVFIKKSLNFFIYISRAKYSEKINKQYRVWFKKHWPSKEELIKQKKILATFKFNPKISIITPTYNTPIDHLRECIESVKNQSYDNWELCLCDDASSEKQVRRLLEEYAEKDKRIKTYFRDKNGHISQASNDALRLATGEYIGLLDHDDFLWPNALYEVLKAINNYPEAEFIYSDEDKLSEQGKHIDPFFKPDWSPHYLRSINYITHLAVLKKSLVDKIGGFRTGFEGAQDWDLFLRASSIINRRRIVHIPTILYSWRKSPYSTASERGAGKVKLYAYENQKKILEDDLRSRGFEGEVVATDNLGSWIVKYKIIGKPLVSIIIPTKDQYRYISRCLRSILAKTTYKKFELILVDTGSTDEKIWNLYKEIKDKYQKTKIVKWDQEFNFADACNFGAAKSSGEYLLFLNNDTEIITPSWIEELLGYAQLPEVGSVGCKLLYLDGSIQHAGIVLGIKGGDIDKGVAGHAFRHFKSGKDIKGALGGVRDCAAVTAACLMIKKNKYFEVGGQEGKFKVAFNDVDLGLKLLEKGYYNLYLGFVELSHKESVSIGKPESKQRDLKQFQEEINFMYEKWEKILENDPFYNENLTLDLEDFSLRV